LSTGKMLLMRLIFLSCLTLLLLASCKKQQGSGVEIYLLKSFTATVDPTTTPAVGTISNAVLDDRPLVADGDIAFYTRSTTTFTLRKNIQPTLQDFGPDKAFAVTVDRQPVYYGRFHPLYLSSITYGVATIAPSLSDNKNLKIDFAGFTGSDWLQQLDKRNDPQIINRLRATGKLH